MLCIYSTIRSDQAEESRGAARWLWVLALASVVGSTNRQIVWVAPIVLIQLLQARRADAGFRGAGDCRLRCFGNRHFAIIHFLSQPYAPLQLSHEEFVSLLRHETGKSGKPGREPYAGERPRFPAGLFALHSH